LKTGFFKKNSVFFCFFFDESLHHEFIVVPLHHQTGTVKKTTTITTTTMKTSNKIVNQVLTIAEPFLNKLVANRKESAIKAEERFTAYDEKMYRIALIIDLVKAAGNYLLNSDELVGTFELKTGKDGSVEIKSRIKREDKIFTFNTRMIYAGGYNIQCLHFRYLVDTNLPKIKNEALEEVKAVEKKMKAEQRILNEIESIDRVIARDEKYLAKEEAKTPQDIENEYYSYWMEKYGRKPQFEMLNEYAKELYKTPEAYEIHEAEEVKRKQDQHIQHIKVLKHYIKQWNAKKKKYQEKLK
jgi:hypothetical protein